MPSPARRRLAWLALAVLLASVAVGAVLRLIGRREGTPAEIAAGGRAAAPEAKKPLYHCPMHPTMVSDRPGDCPICGMRMVPIEEQHAAGADPEGTPGEPPRKKVIYRSTMNPGEVSDRPGKDSMGMEMVPVEVEERVAPGAAKIEGLAPVSIPARKQQLIGIRTTVVRRAPLIRTVRTVGRVTPDETRLRHVHTKTAGWVERLHVDATGQKVRKGEPLLSLYSPELLATQEEYLLALRSRRGQEAGAPPEMVQRADALLESARRRLLLFDLTPAQVDELERTGAATRTVTLHSPISGYVLQRNVTHGQKIDPDMTLLDIADLSRVWVMASVYEYELPFVKLGQPADITLSYLPGKTYRGRVSLIYPVLEEGTRTAQVRLELENPGLELKPGMFTQVAIQSDLGERLSVPESAVLASGTRNIVFVAQGEGYFEPREVQVGLRLPEVVEILGGLSAGETVVASGTFFVDSESKLKAALEAAGAAKPRGEHRH